MTDSMRVIINHPQREVFGWSDDYGFYLSPFATVVNGRRPINRYDTEEELLLVAQDRNCRVTWQTS